MLTVTYAECHIQALYAERCYAECRGAFLEAHLLVVPFRIKLVRFKNTYLERLLISYILENYLMSLISPSPKPNEGKQCLDLLITFVNNSNLCNL